MEQCCTRAPGRAVRLSLSAGTLWIAVACSAGCASTNAAAKTSTAARSDVPAQGQGPSTPESKAERKTPKAEEQPVPELSARSNLPLIMQETLSSSMGRHGELMTFLLQDVVLLQYDLAEELAEMLAEEPKLGRPRPSDHTSLNALLPPSFFVHQDRLSERARAVAKAARERDDGRLVRAFGEIAETCVGCHVSYLRDDLASEPPAPGVL